MSTGSTRPPETAGSSPTQDLRKLLAAWADETGDPLQRPTWADLQLLLLPLKGAPTAFWDTLLPSLPPSQALLATMTLARFDPTVRAAFLKRACSVAPFMPPSQAAMLLKLFPQELVLAGFGPALLAQPPLGPLAAYLLARLGITISPGDLPAVLAVTQPFAGPLENLARLVPPDQCAAVIEDLTSGLASAPSATRPSLEMFLNILKSERRGEPAEPAWARPSAPDQEQSPARPPAGGASTLSKPASPLAQAQARLSGIAADPPAPVPAAGARILPQSLLNLVSGIDRHVLIGIGAIVISIPLVLLSTTGVSPETPAATPMPRVMEKAPKYWTDAVSKRRITHEFLAADNDFQMGEMFLVREEYGEALSLFRDALSRDPEHVGAQFRIGCCLYLTGDRQGAEKAMNTALRMQQDLPEAHLYLARIAAANDDWETCLVHYQKEYELTGEIMVALEYAGILRKLGRFPEAITLLSGLPPRFAGHLEVVNLLAQLRDEAKEPGP